MEFTQRKRRSENEKKYHLENLSISREFSKQLILEMKELVRSVVLFGSNTHDTLKKDSDIDLLVVLDNVSVFVSEELREAYRVITTQLNADLGEGKIHLMTMNLSDLWDMARKGDPVLINILRYGLPLFDRDLVEPLQYLLEIGRMKPSRETVYNYMARSETLVEETKRHLYDATLDLYYSIVDMVHATLILKKQMPPSPKDMPKLFKKVFKGTPLEKHSETIDEFYKIAKDIEKQKYAEMKGSEFDKLHKKAASLIAALKTFNNKELEKTDIFDL